MTGLNIVIVNLTPRQSYRVQARLMGIGIRWSDGRKDPSPQPTYYGRGYVRVWRGSIASLGAMHILNDMYPEIITITYEQLLKVTQHG